MDVFNLKNYIYDNEKIPDILEALGCNHIREHVEYYSCSNPDGDNPSAVIVYKNEYLRTTNYTRNISKYERPDLLSLVEFYHKCTFYEALQFVCEVVGIDYYHDFEEDIPESIKWTRMILAMTEGDEDEQAQTVLKPISEKILGYYNPYVNDMFMRDHISYETQVEFEVGYDDYSNRITIPIRDELGNLVGVKGRWFGEPDERHLKYLYLEPCARSHILYGLHLTYDHIKQKRQCYIGEAEKSCQQLWDMGYKNSVAIGGKQISKYQIEKLTRLCVDLVFLFDEDVTKDELVSIADRFVEGVNIYAIIDKGNILAEKESPTDNPKKFEKLKNEFIYKIK